MFQSRCSALFTGLLLLLLTNQSSALSLADIEVKSSLNEPLLAHIEIEFESPGELEKLQARQLSSSEYKKRGLPYAAFISMLSFELEIDPDSAKPYIRISSKLPMTRPTLDILIELENRHELYLQQFRIRLFAAKDEAPSANDDEGSIIVEHELDPYYSNIGIFVSLTDQAMKEVDLKDESSIYQDLLQESLTPSFFLMEFSVNPLPILGVYLRDQHEDFYEEAEVDDDLNMIQVLTEGFEEPYAISFFLGNVIRFVSPRDPDYLTVNKGFSGLLLSIGDQHIKDSELFDDNWYEIEWKIKGDRRIGSIYHSWSFRVGTKIHSNSDIADVNYIGIRRQYFNDKVARYRWNENIGIEFSLFFSRATGEVVQQQLFVEKKWPSRAGEFSLGIGLNRNIERYTGDLADEDDDDDLKLIVRPGFNF